MAEDWSIVTRLNVRNLFPNEGVVKRNKEDDGLLEELFEHSTRATLFIHDDEDKGHSCFIADTKGIGSDKVLTVTNSSHGDAFLMHIDGVLFPRRSKCDCALLSANEFDFIEFKSNAINRTEVSMKDQYDKCYNQLRITVEDFDSRYHDKGEDFRAKFKEMRAFAVFNPTVPSDNATKKALSAKFLKDKRMILSFTNKTKIASL